MLSRLKQLSVRAYSSLLRLKQWVTWGRSIAEHERAALRELARETSCAMTDLSLRLSLSPSTTLTVLSSLERREPIQFSPYRGSEHVRIIAITARGRSEVAGQFPEEKRSPA